VSWMDLKRHTELPISFQAGSSSAVRIRISPVIEKPHDIFKCLLKDKY